MVGQPRNGHVDHDARSRSIGQRTAVGIDGEEDLVPRFLPVEEGDDGPVLLRVVRIHASFAWPTTSPHIRRSQSARRRVPPSFIAFIAFNADRGWRRGQGGRPRVAQGGHRARAAGAGTDQSLVDHERLLAVRGRAFTGRVHSCGSSKPDLELPQCIVSDNLFARRSPTAQTRPSQTNSLSTSPPPLAQPTTPPLHPSSTSPLPLPLLLPLLPKSNSKRTRTNRSIPHPSRPSRALPQRSPSSQPSRPLPARLPPRQLRT